ncbi:MAG TPA: G1 family glutamic endopeptidase [Candidatus Bathyarchaeia archaeon]|nr:G1 family glutamic endopeptidase [Candidatus Bathyarchaeia archaeon]
MAQKSVASEQPAPKLVTCQSCRRLVPNTTVFCPWCAGRLAPVLTTPIGSQVLATEPQRPGSWVPYREEKTHEHRIYKISIAVLLLALVGLGAVVANMTKTQFSPVLPRNPYSVVGQDFSTSWSGYKLYHPISSITDVKGTWIVPVMNCTRVTADQYSSFWVGIDGVRNDTGTLEQTGIVAGCMIANGMAIPVYESFVEWYPASPKSFNKPVSAGDKVTAEVSWSNNVFTATLADFTQGWTGSDVNSTIDRSAWRASAEWIVEAPLSLKTNSTVPLAKFDKVYFSNCIVTTADSSGPMGSFSLVQDTMVDSAGYAKARSFLPFWNDGTSFSVWWMSAGP